MQPRQSCGFITGGGLAFPARPRIDDLTLPARVLIAEAAEPGNHRQSAFFERAVLAVFAEITAEIAQCAPRTFGSSRQTWVSQVDGCENSHHENNA